MKEEINWSELEGFEWDKGNVEKNRQKHAVSPYESEQVFYDPTMIVFDDEIHSKNEKRFGALGKTVGGRLITVFFTIRSNRIRVISARDQSKKERKLYKEGVIDELN